MELIPIDSNTTHPFGGLIKVNGRIIARQIEVTSIGWWADKVFEKEYHLMPLDSLEAYLFNYKHLPEIPTSDEVMENGLNIGEFNALLLKKIEELYLYIIEQNKQINEHNNYINSFKKKYF